MRIRYQMIEVDTSDIIGCQNNGMIGRHFLDGIDRNCSFFIQIIQIFNISFLTHLDKAQENSGGTFCIINRTVMMVQRNSNRFCYGVKFKTI